MRYSSALDGEGLSIRQIPFHSLVLRVENDPADSAEESVARDIAARLTFLKPDNSEAFSIEGRWSDSTQPSNLGPDRTVAELKTATIWIGTSRELDLVLRYDHETWCYAVNNQSYGFHLLQNPAWRLDVGDHRIKVRLRGPNVDQTFLLKFRNPPDDAPLEAVSCEEVIS